MISLSIYENSKNMKRVISQIKPLPRFCNGITTRFCALLSLTAEPHQKPPQSNALFLREKWRFLLKAHQTLPT